MNINIPLMKRKYSFSSDNERTHGNKCLKICNGEEKAPTDKSTNVPQTPPNNNNNLNTNELQLNEIRLAKIKDIIGREFDKEIQYRKKQIAIINERKTKTRLLLDRLRYVIVSDYYEKQQLALSNAEAATVRGDSTLFTVEPNGPQMPLHPAIKKLIGKKPKNNDKFLQEIHQQLQQQQSSSSSSSSLRTSRTAAQKAKQTFRNMYKKTRLEKRKERELQRKIRHNGIVIDHSKQENQVVAAETKTNSEFLDKSNNTRLTAESAIKPNQVPISTLNASRMNNKTKHLVVVGNTSKYIGTENEFWKEIQTTNSLPYTHKWLVYIQSKDKSVPLEKHVKKVRFYLHHSYRPNDIVEVLTPPFQLSQRGWGEFPIKIQLFFHEELQQRPIQFIHNLVLDRTLTGLETMGAETIVEIWLRSELIANENKIANESETNLPHNNVRVDVKASSKANESIEQHLEIFQFLDKLKEEPLEPLPSFPMEFEKIEPNRTNTFRNHSLLNDNKKETNNNISQSGTKNVKNANNKWNSIPSFQQGNESGFVNLDLQKSQSFNQRNLLQTNRISEQNSRRIGEYSETSSSQTTTNNVDVRNPATAIEKLSTSEIRSQSANSLRQISDKSATVNVFERDGRLFIQDPIQMKLKLEQKKQVSLLKPRVNSLLNQKLERHQEMLHGMFSNAARNVAHDHGYAAPPPPLLYTSIIQPQFKKPQSQKIDVVVPKTPLIPFKQKEFLSKFRSRLFSSMRNAVEYLLQRLPLYPETPTSIAHHLELPFSKATRQDFESIPGIKQRSCEWLRAKYICACLKSHPHLKDLCAKGQEECYWTTREIIIFARLHAYTPVLKPIILPTATTTTTTGSGGHEVNNAPNLTAVPFSTLVKSELKHEQQLAFQYETLTEKWRIENWLENVRKKLSQRMDEQQMEERETIEIIDIENSETTTTKSLKKLNFDNKDSSFDVNSKRMMHFIPAPKSHELETQFVNEKCREIGINLQPEEIIDGVLQPTAQILLATCLKNFLSRLLRRAAATKLQQQQQLLEEETNTKDQWTSQLTAHTIDNLDIGRVIGQNVEYDFLTNRHFGAVEILSPKHKEQ